MLCYSLIFLFRTWGLGIYKLIGCFLLSSHKPLCLILSHSVLGFSAYQLLASRSTGEQISNVYLVKLFRNRQVKPGVKTHSHSDRLVLNTAQLTIDKHNRKQFIDPQDLKNRANFPTEWRLLTLNALFAGGNNL